LQARAEREEPVAVVAELAAVDHLAAAGGGDHILTDIDAEDDVAGQGWAVCEIARQVEVKAAAAPHQFASFAAPAASRAC